MIMARRQAFLAMLVLLAPIAQAGGSDGSDEHGRSNWLLFGNADANALEGDASLYDSTDLVVAADLLGSWETGSFRILGELFLSTEEQELERLQLGWEVVPETYAWLGRFHQPGSAWNTRYHHGQFLQPSITRPTIESWEDEGGVLPQHLVGALGETRLQLADESGFLLAAGAGIGPVMTPSGLAPVSLFHARGVERRPTFSFRAAFLQDLASDDGIELVAMRSEIGLSDSGYAGPSSHVDLDAVGLSLGWALQRWQLVSTIYAMNAKFVGDGGGNDEFFAGYLQLSRKLGRGLSLLGRFEGSAHTNDSRYLALFPDFVSQRAVFDLRWDLAPQQALSLEFAAAQGRYGNFQELRLQWSAVFP